MGLCIKSRIAISHFERGGAGFPLKFCDLSIFVETHYSMYFWILDETPKDCGAINFLDPTY